MICQICFQPKRKAKFISSRLAICQWCITEICDAQKAPSQILSEELEAIKRRLVAGVNREIEVLEQRRRTLPPELNKRELENTLVKALREVKLQEGILTSMYCTLIDESERQAKALDIANKRREEIIARHQAACTEHANRIKECESNLALLRIKRDAIPDEATLELDQFHATALSPIPAKTREIRLLRAHALGLVTSAHEQLARPEQDDSAHEELKRGIRRQDNFRCICCGKDGSLVELHVHHVVPLCKFGTNDAANLVTVCLTCHRKAHRRDGATVTRNRPTRRKPKLAISRFVAADIETTGFSNSDEIEAGLVFIELSRIKTPPAPRRRRVIPGVIETLASSLPLPNDYHIYPCPQCNQRLRVPAGMLLDITCPTCRHLFRKFTAP